MRLSRYALVLCAVLAGGSAGAQDAPPALRGELKARLQQAEADPALARQLIARGRQTAEICVRCHGNHGIAVRAGVPSLAGRDREYLLEQLQRFTDGQRHELKMQLLVLELGVDEKVGVALFFSSQRIRKPAAPAGLSASLP